MRTAGYHEILLVNAKQSALLITVIRIQKQRQIPSDIRFIELNALFNDALLNTFHIKQMQTVLFPVKADNIHIVAHRLQGTAWKLNLKINRHPIKPADRVDPCVWQLCLLMI